MVGIVNGPAMPMMQGISQVGGFGTLSTVNPRSSATLILIPPRRISRQYRRPFEFAFTRTFADSLQEAVVATNETGKPEYLHSIINNPIFAEQIAPSSVQNGYNVSLDRYSGSWTFIFSIDNDVVPGVKIIDGRATRTVYTGLVICQEEPVNPLTGTPNPAAVLSVTHVTNMAKLTSFSAGGYSQNITNTADIDILNGQNYTVLSEPSPYFVTNLEEAFYAQTPMSNRMMQDGLQPMDLVIGSNKAIANQAGDIRINTRTANPMDQKRRVVSAVNQAYNTILDNKIGGTLSNAQGMVPDVNAFVTAVGNRLSDPVHTFGSLEEGTITMAGLIDRYRPKIVPVPAFNEEMIDVCSQEYDSVTNFYCAILAASLPGVVTNFGLTDFTFAYRGIFGAEPVWEPYDIKAPVDGLTDADLKQRAMAVYRNIRDEIAPVLLQGYGDFTLHASISITGTTRLQLIFHANSGHPGIYEVPSFLGGYNTPVIGKSITLENNSTSLYKLMQMVDVGITDQEFNLNGAVSQIQQTRGYTPQYGNGAMTLPNPTLVQPVYGGNPGLVTPNNIGFPNSGGIPQMQPAPVVKQGPKFAGDDWAS